MSIAARSKIALERKDRATFSKPQSHTFWNSVGHRFRGVFLGGSQHPKQSSVWNLIAACLVVEFYFVFRCRSAAFSVRAFAAAFDALIALARRSSALIFSARAWPPMRPRALIASDTRLILRPLVMYLLGVFRFIRASYTVRHGDTTVHLT